MAPRARARTTRRRARRRDYAMGQGVCTERPRARRIAVREPNAHRPLAIPHGDRLGRAALAAKRRKAPRTPGRPPTAAGNTLDIPRIVDAAWTVVDRDGINALSTRNVAAELNVRGPALYWHVQSKQDLMSLMIEHALRDSLQSLPTKL